MAGTLAAAYAAETASAQLTRVDVLGPFAVAVGGYTPRER